MAALSVALTLLMLANVVWASAGKHYSGKTSQHQSISFAISAGKLTRLRFGIITKCSHHKKLRFLPSGFQAFAISGSSFDQKFQSKSGTARISGKLSGATIRGTLALRTTTPHCSGSATYKVTPVHRRRHHPAG